MRFLVTDVEVSALVVKTVPAIARGRVQQHPWGA